MFLTEQHLPQIQRSVKLNLKRINNYILIKPNLKRFNATEVCGKAFEKAINLQRHIDIHNNVHFECDLCDKKFSRMSYLNVHKIRVHDGPSTSAQAKAATKSMEKSFKCDICNEDFSRKRSLVAHKFREHGGNSLLCR